MYYITTLHSYSGKYSQVNRAISYPQLSSASLSCGLHLCNIKGKNTLLPGRSLWDVALPV